MAETVSTGGNVQFRYSKNHSPELKKEQKTEIEQAYDKYYERRKREKRRRNIIILVVTALIILGALAFVFLRQ